MSQVTFHTDHQGERIEVLAGWDTPLRYFFLVLYGPKRELLYSNLDHRDPAWLGRDTSLFRKELQTRGITPPEGFWERVERREGNVVHHHTGGQWSPDWD